MWSNCHPKSGFLSIYFEFFTYDQRLKGVVMLESHAFFSKMVDELVEFSEYENSLLSCCDIIRDERECGVSNGTACYENGKRVLSIQLTDIVKIEPGKIVAKYI